MTESSYETLLLWGSACASKSTRGLSELLCLGWGDRRLGLLGWQRRRDGQAGGYQRRNTALTTRELAWKRISWLGIPWRLGVLARALLMSRQGAKAAECNVTTNTRDTQGLSWGVFSCGSSMSWFPRIPSLRSGGRSCASRCLDGNCRCGLVAIDRFRRPYSPSRAM